LPRGRRRKKKGKLCYPPGKEKAPRLSSEQLFKERKRVPFLPRSPPQEGEGSPWRATRKGRREGEGSFEGRGGESSLPRKKQGAVCFFSERAMEKDALVSREKKEIDIYRGEKKVADHFLVDPKKKKEGCCMLNGEGRRGVRRDTNFLWRGNEGKKRKLLYNKLKRKKKKSISLTTTKRRGEVFLVQIPRKKKGIAPRKRGKLKRRRESKFGISWEKRSSFRHKQTTIFKEKEKKRVLDGEGRRSIARSKS